MLRIFIRQIASPFDLLLIAVAALSLALHQRTDSAIVLTIVAFSVALGVRNEYRAERILADLRSRISHKASVVRDGAIVRVDAGDVVPGDVLALTIGDVIPADVRITESHGIECDESALTGESRPAIKRPDDRAFMGTAVCAGYGRALVQRAGRQTRYGEIAEHAHHRRPPTAFELGMRGFSLMLVYVTVVVSAAVFGVSAFVLHRSPVESMLFALAISVSLTPQMLPVIVSVSLSVGGYRMAKSGAIVRRLISIEDIGNVQVLFTDKTGTLTTGVPAFERAVDASGADSETVLLYALLSSAALHGGEERAAVNALDAALVASAPVQLRTRAAACELSGDVPFDYERRMVSVAARIGARSLLVAKGAPESVFARCTALDARVRDRVDAFESRGARVLAVAAREFPEGRAPVLADEANFTYAGLLVFGDPPKPGVDAALAKLEALDVRVKVITGDGERAARALCERVGLPVGASIEGPALDALTDAQLLARLPQLDLFARISPLQKERIIRVQRTAGVDTGFLGDGINDALALRAADVGISVDSAADVAKDASDVVLLSKDLGILAEGVAQGRRIFANTIKYVLMAVSSNFGNMMSAAIGAVVLPFLPLLPSQVLLNNLLYDVSETTIPTDRVDEELLRRPEHWDLGLVRRFMLFFGPASAVSDLAVFAVMTFAVPVTVQQFRAGFFIESFATQALVVFLLRTRHVPFTSSKPSPQLAATTAIAAAIGIALPFSPIAGVLGFAPVPLALGIWIAAMAAAYVVAVELTKLFVFRASSR